MNPVVLDQTGQPIGDPITWFPTETGSALEQFYEAQVKAAADADLAGKADWDWYFSPWYACPDACGTVMPSKSGAAWPTSTVQAGIEAGESGWWHGEEIQTVLLTLAGDTYRLGNYDAASAVGRAHLPDRVDN